MQPQIGVSAIGWRLVQVSGHAQLAGDSYRANWIFLLLGNGLIRAIGGAGRSEPRSREVEAERSSVPLGRDGRISPR